jgi:hypothetical protein
LADEHRQREFEVDPRVRRDVAIAWEHDVVDEGLESPFGFHLLQVGDEAFHLRITRHGPTPFSTATGSLAYSSASLCRHF